jgi:hypothetical protein
MTHRLIPLTHPLFFHFTLPLIVILNAFNFNQLKVFCFCIFRPMRRVQQAAYPMVKLTQAEIAAMIGRREERRRLAEVREVHPPPPLIS